ncbi:MAG: RDD family protein [Candidatus Limnocylindrales bacterium]|nr:RDD family protein [Candidatus Limnocylindrales bacterium]
MDQSGSTGDPGTPSSSGWAAPPPPVQAGPAGFVYADVPNRAIAYIIDVILVAIVAGIIGVILAGIGLSTGSFAPGTLNFSINYVGLIVSAIVGAAISAAYFIYTWTSMRGTVGMKALGMQIGNAGDGKTLTMDQATRRWLVIAAPGILAQVLFVIPQIGALLGLLALGWFIYLLWTTYSSPTKQGFHDKFANTMVVKAARAAG